MATILHGVPCSMSILKLLLHNAARLDHLHHEIELNNHANRCVKSAIIEKILDDLIDKIEFSVFKCFYCSWHCNYISYWEKEMTWVCRSLMISFYLHQDLGNLSFKMFKDVWWSFWVHGKTRNSEELVMKGEHLQMDFNCQVRNPRMYNENCSIEKAIFVCHA